MTALDFDQRLESTMNRIEESDQISPKNKELLRTFKRDLTLQDMSKAWIDKLLSHMKVVAEQLGNDNFDELDKEDLKDLIEWVQSRDIAKATVGDYKQVIRRFWKWLNDGEHPKETAWIRTRTQRQSNTLPKDLLDRDDVNALIDGTRNARDAALIALLWETGARIGELIDLTVGDIEDHQNGRKVVVDGKTGPRRLLLYESVPYLNRWLSDHPEPEKSAPLWSKLQDGTEGVSYEYLRQKILERAKERADIDKPVNPHHFRHSRATYLANELTEAQLRQWFGWAPGSSTPSKYVHLSGRDIDNAYRELHGLASEDEDEPDETIRECPRCTELNAPDAAFCSNCGQALDTAVATRVESTEDTVTETASTDDLQLAQQLVQAMKDDRDDLEEFLETLD
jgi:site-specific recombinase XerD